MTGKNGQIFFLIDSEKIIMITKSDIFSSNVEKPKKKFPFVAEQRIKFMPKLSKGRL